MSAEPTAIRLEQEVEKAKDIFVTVSAFTAMNNISDGTRDFDVKSYIAMIRYTNIINTSVNQV